MDAVKVLVTIAIAGLAAVAGAAFVGNIIRVRAQYAPKEEHPDSIDNREVMGVSFLRTLKRVTRVEGWRGLLRGIVPLAITSLCSVLLFWLIGESGVKAIPSIHPVSRAIVDYVGLVLLDVPLSILFIRSVTVAELLPFFNFRRGINALFSSTERSRPWLLYCAPGLFLTIALQHALDIIFVPVLVEVISRHVPEAVVPMEVNHNLSLQVLAKFGPAVLNTLLITPLQVVKVRLAVQRRKEQAISLTDAPLSEGEETVPVVRLRTQTERPAYTGLLDCVRSIVAEEGCDTLYRVWWFTFLGSLLQVSVDRYHGVGH